MPIKEIITSNGSSPVKIWTEDIEAEARAQLLNTARLPFIFKHVAVMPDVHWGMGATVGSVVATQGAVCPAAVGVDIGCGMAAAKIFGLLPRDLEGKLKDIRHNIERSIPVGFHGNKTIGEDVDSWGGWEQFKTLNEKAQGLRQKAAAQLSSLGGGNHFIEICLDTKGFVWVLLHSGSRNIGKSVADIHIRRARGIMKKMFIDLPDPDLAYFAQQTPEYDEYMNDLLWCQAYARKNRDIMMARIFDQLRRMFGDIIAPVDVVNCHHNFATMESHFGSNVLVTRKGAVRARVGDMGIIPGSMGTRSYIVRGLGNPDSFNSCSHGAGRRMSRKKAKKTFSLEDLAKQTEGVECRKDKDVLDEIPGAYKPIEQVMADQSDLVEVVVELKQVVCVKG